MENETKSPEKFQVQILPQDDNWGANTTAFTNDDFDDDMTEDGRSTIHNYTGRINNPNRYPKGDLEIINNNGDMIDIKPNSTSAKLNSFKHYCSRYFGFICSIIIFASAFLTPILFIILPQFIAPKTSNNQDKFLIVTSNSSNCGIECESLLISIAFKLFILLIGTWAVFCRVPQASLPRIYEVRSLLIVLLVMLNISYWFFYSVRILDSSSSINSSGDSYQHVLQFTIFYVDLLLVLFFISVCLLEIKPLKSKYVIKMVRSPDGEQCEYTLGEMSIQRAAAWLLEQYYKDFGVYNPWLENAHRKRGAQLLQLEQQAAAAAAANKKRSKSSGVNISKHYDDNNDDDLCNMSQHSRRGRSNRKNNNNEDGNETCISVNSRKPTRQRSNNNGDTVSLIGGGLVTANDRFYEEYEYERRLRKRRARLLTCTEEAFTRIKRISQTQYQEDYLNEKENTLIATTQTATSMDPFEAAQAVFTSIARDLRRYLRVTRQQPYFTRDSIIAHLANCISYDMSPRSFLQRYLNKESLVFNERELVNSNKNGARSPISVLPMNGVSAQGVNYHLNLKTSDQDWILICDTSLYQSVEDNLMIVLKQNEVSLMCTFKKLPHFNLIEDILDPKRNKFVLKLNSETTV
jgi:vang-like